LNVWNGVPLRQRRFLSDELELFFCPLLLRTFLSLVISLGRIGPRRKRHKFRSPGRFPIGRARDNRRRNPCGPPARVRARPPACVRAASRRAHTSARQPSAPAVGETPCRGPAYASTKTTTRREWGAIKHPQTEEGKRRLIKVGPAATSECLRPRRPCFSFYRDERKRTKPSSSSPFSSFDVGTRTHFDHIHGPPASFDQASGTRDEGPFYSRKT